MNAYTAWQFETANLVVLCDCEPEKLDPADSFEFQDDIDAVRNGDVLWFCAVVTVRHKPTGAVLGRDVLGACAYRTTEKFTENHRDPDPMNRNSSLMRAQPGQSGTAICHYFPSMVAEACKEARKSLRGLATIPVRT